MLMMCALYQQIDQCVWSYQRIGTYKIASEMSKNHRMEGCKNGLTSSQKRTCYWNQKTNGSLDQIN
jgi:hypothetical protein